MVSGRSCGSEVLPFSDLLRSICVSSLGVPYVASRVEVYESESKVGHGLSEDETEGVRIQGDGA